MSELRDHSKPCEHGKRHTHASIPSGELIEAWCPGGREVTIDSEMIRRSRQAIKPHISLRAFNEVGISGIHVIVDAAIGNPDDSA